MDFAHALENGLMPAIQYGRILVVMRSPTAASCAREAADVVVIGGGPAGCAAALRLARRGYSVPT